MGGVLLTQQQQKDFAAGETILVKDMKRDGKGELIPTYVRYDFEAGKPNTSVPTTKCRTHERLHPLRKAARR